MTIHTLDKAVAGLLILFGGWLIWTGLDYGIMQGTTPGAGLFPLIMGIAIVVLSAINLFRAVTNLETLSAGMSRREIIKAAGVVVVLIVSLLLIPVLGMTLATLGAMVVIGLLLRTDPSRAFLVRLAAVSLLTPIICWWLFDGLLGVPVPVGPLGF
ncbi:tripartite tricarboxylate transporter TctB family protein [Methylobrevis albus]|uniref:Tripartite tricarboxylate transporter TctB family protein n=1 Tax=Methylobrevis albus TaxID=2793297 RepID=A0A931N0U6_9HYPH|nr:tripartite tricarboxylate transporter TctB family protein [Methylobrevis albus]MBH0239604.1 tripartite tricarboxylate transporter TctB family protein [Methylobrevis albus]